MVRRTFTLPPELAADIDREALAIEFSRNYGPVGLQLADAVVMAIADLRSLPVLTWDFRHLRAVVRANGRPFELLVQEHELPGV